MTANLSGQLLPEGRRHFCRGCGSGLPAGFRGLYHKECLRADKRWRICDQRRREQERFRKRLGKELCPHCGAGYGNQQSERNVEPPCEASQPTQERIRPSGEDQGLETQARTSNGRGGKSRLANGRRKFGFAQ